MSAVRISPQGESVLDCVAVLIAHEDAGGIGNGILWTFIFVLLLVPLFRVVLAAFFNCSRVVGQVESPTGVGATYAMDAYVRSPGPAPLRLRSSGLLNLTSYICWVIWFQFIARQLFIHTTNFINWPSGFWLERQWMGLKHRGLVVSWRNDVALVSRETGDVRLGSFPHTLWYNSS